VANIHLCVTLYVHLALHCIVQVAAALQAPNSNVKLLDASWHMGGARNGYEEYLQAHVPAAAFFDIDAIADTASSLPHMLPTADLFAQKVSDLGLKSDDSIVIYTSHDCFSAARCWW
jgi:thiosulfate/3-mercaptopyruvate sulfurtransferase